MSFTLKPITETSWILQKDSTRLSLLVASPEGTITAMGGLEKRTFKSFDDLSLYLGDSVSIEQPLEESADELGDIRGYPVKHTGIAEVQEHKELPVYKRGNTEHAAGYYGVKFNHGWTPSYCPKLTTITENEYIGPFKTKLEMQNGITQKKRAIEI